ncbi:methyl-accepting chemotaxis protein [Geobacter sp. SVR]|uniref:methyl-accepting chemotaxis protein n=1 Tax=Geobacter sp. SVR TaxID=2495594 RepID=UPI00143EF511|nr:methyl-accepting chemotaxis protein [Geobacter sp. SVR]BCS54287.1 methyl-accepting chemotaxis protein [Geobacter sp. SVR]GCF85854.1 methyl-accepting chemotaxis protein [Geobacter sp. SVR]
MKIRTKLVIAFLVVNFLTLLVGLFSIQKISQLLTISTDIASAQVPTISAIKEIDSLVGGYRRSELLMVLAKEQQDIDKYVKRADEAAGKLKTKMAGYEKLIDSEEERTAFEVFKKELAEWQAVHPKIVALALQGQDGEATSLILGDSSRHFNAAIKSLDDSLNANIKQIGTESSESLRINSSARLWIVIALIVTIILGLVIALSTARKISTPIADLAHQARQVADGNLAVTIEQSSNDEVGSLAASFGQMIGNLRDIIANVAATSGQVASAANQLNSTAEQIATGAEQVVGQTSTVATATEEMAATSGDIARNCSMAAHSAQQANVSALAGSSVIRGTVEGMNRIATQVKGTAASVEGLGARSDQIGAIVGTIEDIADQTNLLALNAAIEAARAGEQGRGFAVVADEVRALAERTTRATREIGEMIKAIQQETRSAVAAMNEGVREVVRGTEEASQSDEALQSILDQIATVNMQVNQIATAAEEQTATTNQISSNVLQITEVVTHTAAGAQESAAASAQLASLAGNLQSLISRFRL